ncbi:glutathione S-transferase N-terminal domain-containing protein [Reinekea forsetii]|nr:glutathione S-transferase N-terminal domain-containing protein [Reinekea forsetii]
MAVIRWFLGILILSYEKVASPKGVQRSSEQQVAIDEATKSLTLYQYKACPFCLKVRFAMKRQSLAIETKDAKRSELARAELLAGGGLLKVPCLKIVDNQGAETWMYESSDIISYLNRRFDAPVAV